MEKPLFIIECTTCRAKLNVHDDGLIGEILECPKCQSFVHVIPPSNMMMGDTVLDAPPVDTTDELPAESDAPPVQTDAPPVQADVPPIQTEAPPVQAEVPPVQQPVEDIAPVQLRAVETSDDEGLPTDSLPVASPIEEPTVAPPSALPTPPEPPLEEGFDSPAENDIEPPPVAADSSTGSEDLAEDELPRMKASQIDPNQKKMMILGGAGLVVAILLIAIFSGMFGSDPQQPDDSSTPVAQNPDPSSDDSNQPGASDETTDGTAGDTSNVEPTADPDDNDTNTEPTVSTPESTDPNAADTDDSTSPVEPATDDPLSPAEPTVEVDPNGNPLDPGAIDPLNPNPLNSDPLNPDPLAPEPAVAATGEGTDGNTTEPDTTPDVVNPLMDPREAISITDVPSDDLPDNDQPVEPVIDPGADRVALGAVPIQDLLSFEIPDIKLDSIALGPAVVTLGRFGGVPLSFDPIALQRTGNTLLAPIRLNESGITVKEGLDLVLAQRNLGLRISPNGRLTVTYPESYFTDSKTRPYTVDDLTLGDPAAAAALAGMIEQLVAADWWRRADSPQCSVVPQGGNITVTDAPAGHLAIIDFCERLRLARGLEPKTPNGRQRYTLNDRTTQGRALLKHEILANFKSGAPLIRVVGELAKQSGAMLLLDRAALAEAGVDDTTEVSPLLWKVPLEDALESLLQPLGLTYRVINSQMIQITSAQRADELYDIEFYDVAKVLKTAGGTGDELATMVRRTILPDTWSAAEGRGVVLYDKQSGRLIVRQTQAAQRQLRKELGL